MSRYLLDTNVLLGYTKSANWIQVLRDDYNLDDSHVILFTSIICCGEILALAERNNWGKSRKDELQNTLNQITTINIDKEPILNAYAMIGAWTQGHSVATQKSPPPKPAMPMGQNDLWIAATAHVSGATLLSTDKDFSHLNNVWIKYIYVDQTK